MSKRSSNKKEAGDSCPLSNEDKFFLLSSLYLALCIWSPPLHSLQYSSKRLNDLPHVNEYKCVYINILQKKYYKSIIQDKNIQQREVKGYNVMEYHLIVILDKFINLILDCRQNK